eukprot:8746283-Lingulodinium_polyedra.AAC.1
MRAVGKIVSCTSGTGNAVGPCDATDTLCLARKLSSTLPLPKERLANAPTVDNVTRHRFLRGGRGAAAGGGGG